MEEKADKVFKRIKANFKYKETKAKLKTLFDVQRKYFIAMEIYEINTIDTDELDEIRVSLDFYQYSLRIMYEFGYYASILCKTIKPSKFPIKIEKETCGYFSEPISDDNFKFEFSKNYLKISILERRGGVSIYIINGQKIKNIKCLAKMDFMETEFCHL